MGVTEREHLNAGYQIFVWRSFPCVDMVEWKVRVQHLSFKRFSFSSIDYSAQRCYMATCNFPEVLGVAMWQR